MALAIRVCTIDIGSNSARSLIAEASGPDNYRVLDDERLPTRLAEGQGKEGALATSAIDRTVAAVAKLVSIARGHEVRLTRAVATSAIREAANRDVILGKMREQCGLEVEVITGEHEAKLAWISALRVAAGEALPWCAMDLGGGSLELVLCVSQVIEQLVSLPLGAVRLTEAWLPRDPIAPRELKALRKHVRGRLREALERWPREVGMVVGSGGSISALAAMVQALGNRPSLRAHGYDLYRSEVLRQTELLGRLPISERRKVAGLSPDRADIIVAGAVVIDEVMKVLHANLLRHNARGVREGLLLETLARHFGTEPDSPLPRMQTVRRFARRCRVEEAHAEQVTRLALAIFDGLSGPFGIEATDRELLEAGAVLHDVGYAISYTKNHKHAYQLIRHAPLAGLSAREVELVALLARYHRAAPPKRKHEGFGSLNRQDRRRVRRLAAILRIADGLDRTHAGVIETLTVRASDDVVSITAFGRGDLSVEAWGAEKRLDLFRRAFGVRARVEVRPSNGDATSESSALPGRLDAPVPDETRHSTEPG